MAKQSQGLLCGCRRDAAGMPNHPNAATVATGYRPGRPPSPTLGCPGHPLGTSGSPPGPTPSGRTRSFRHRTRAVATPRSPRPSRSTRSRRLCRRLAAGSPPGGVGVGVGVGSQDFCTSGSAPGRPGRLPGDDHCAPPPLPFPLPLSSSSSLLPPPPSPPSCLAPAADFFLASGGSRGGVGVQRQGVRVTPGVGVGVGSGGDPDVAVLAAGGGRVVETVCGSNLVYCRVLSRS